MNAIATVGRSELINVLQTSLYPGASPASIEMVLSYCQAAGLDPMQKPVHIVPMWDSKSGRMRDVVMPGIGLYRVQAARTGEFAGVSEPEFGPDETRDIGGQTITFPAWCRVTVKRLLPGGHVAEFTAVERWTENYAVKGGKEKSLAPNAMWARRPYGQLAKCAEAQALRKAFPELGSAPSAEEMEGKPIIEAEVISPAVERFLLAMSSAGDMAALDAIALELSQAADVTATEKPMLRAAYTARKNELRAVPADVVEVE